MKLTSASVLLAGLLVISACKREKESVLPEGGTPGTNVAAGGNGTFNMQFHNHVKDQDLNLGNVWYTTDDGDTYRITHFNYYISNITFNAADGSRYAEPESYHLVKQDVAESRQIVVNNVPAGEYTSVSFMIGVDFYRNIGGARTGALDTANGMYMGEGKGYIMAMLAGFAPRSPNGGKLKYHIGGYDGVNNAIKNVTLQFKQPVTISGNNQSLHINADAATWFDGVHAIDFATLPSVDTIGPGAKMISENYANMFSLGEDGHTVQ